LLLLLLQYGYCIVLSQTQLSWEIDIAKLEIEFATVLYRIQFYLPVLLFLLSMHLALSSVAKFAAS